MTLRQFIPQRVKLAFRLFTRHFYDWKRGNLALFPKPTTDQPQWSHTISLEQAIRPSHLYENKIHNLRLAGKRIGALLMPSEAIFSFWKAVGRPGRKNGFRRGRNILNGVLQEDYGGGLCQVSGMLYYLALQTGLDIIERHNHSVDIYTDETRFAPLGSDATVVYGYKDLRIRNNTTKDLQFEVLVLHDRIQVNLHANTPLTKRLIRFRISDNHSQIEVTTIGENDEILEKSIYQK